MTSCLSLLVTCFQLVYFIGGVRPALLPGRQTKDASEVSAGKEFSSLQWLWTWQKKGVQLAVLSEDLPGPSGEVRRLNLPHGAAEIKCLLACTPQLKVQMQWAASNLTSGQKASCYMPVLYAFES